MAPGTWIALGDEYTVALANAVVYCRPSPIPMTNGERAGVPLGWYGSGRDK
jgi:hypothetical protein